MGMPRVAASQDSVADAEALVRAQWYEGIPFASARAVTPDGAERLVEMLGSPDERDTHAATIEVLGIAGHAGAYEAIASYAARLPDGEITADELRGCRAVPLAMGHLAGRDPRAIGYLAAAARRDRVGWRHGHMDEGQVAALLKELAIAGLGLSGDPNAAAVLRELESETAGGALVPHVRDALAQHARVSERGPEHVFGGGEAIR
jgi:hypothetical protein